MEAPFPRFAWAWVGGFGGKLENSRSFLGNRHQNDGHFVSVAGKCIWRKAWNRHARFWGFCCRGVRHEERSPRCDMPLGRKPAVNLPATLGI